ncbi:AAA family ATPase [Yersinia enterocolitica]|uniref:AAA family ATPase n=1 Tax=Yersinia enterocolitica TaxID=630 RepID=UPI001C60F8CA|nr:AAA family ATPase [Yersinia enterocolitica]MBW5877773.1 AAA family ATPase [Yersinia enterocolitica]
MLERISYIRAVGLLHDVNAAKFKLKKANFIYADNGRGKSTLASIFRSYSQSNPALIINRKTLGSTDEQKVELHFSNGNKAVFDKTAWDNKHTEMLVFDLDFVEQNVYSGGQVTAGQRQNLLNFAIGNSAVKAQKELDAALSNHSASTKKIKTLTDQLSGIHSGLTLPNFIKLKKTDNIDEMIKATNVRIAATESNLVIQKKSLPQLIELPPLNIDNFFQILNTSLEGIDLKAEEKVKQHIVQHGGGNIENWLSQGAAFIKNDTCPYCDQSLDGLALVTAYRTYFNLQYKELVKNVSSLSVGIETRLGVHVLEKINHAHQLAQTVYQSWSEYVAIQEIPFNLIKVTISLDKLKNILLSLAKDKINNPLDKIGTDAELMQCRDLWKDIIDAITECNDVILERNATINLFKQNLASENLQLLKEILLSQQVAKKRYEQPALDLIKEYSAEKLIEKAASSVKDAKKTALNVIMTATLNKYENTINGLLLKFGANFSIKEVKFNYLGGGAPRSEYVIEMRGQNISLSGGNPDFRSSLSEGDKRTLAFAFFIAVLQNDNEISNKIVVIDDPMCSLDLNRKSYTVTILKEICESCKQLIVLAHDVYFIKKLRDEFSGRNSNIDTLLLKLQHSKGSFSEVNNIDIDVECESKYFKHHRIVNEYILGNAHNSAEVAKAIRPMLEGYLHSRFPNHIAKDLMFGQIVAAIQNSNAGSPLNYATSLIPELNGINTYAGKFHHDTNPGADAEIIVDAELLSFANRAMTLMYKGV